MIKFQLHFDEKNEMFMGEFKELPKEFIGFLKEQGFLKYVTDEYIESLPDLLNGELNIDPDANTDDSLWVFFYFNTKVPPEMNTPTQEYLNRDIDINEDDGTLEFNIMVPKDSEIITKSNNQEIVLEF